MNFLQMKQRLAGRRNAASGSLNPATASRYGDALNEAHRALLRRPGMEALRNDIITFASVAGQQAYCLPAQGVARINRIWETTNDVKLNYRTLDWLRVTDPDPQEGTPWCWIPTGFAEVHTQPPLAGWLYAVSSDAGTPTLFVEGITTGGYPRMASVALTGTVQVSLNVNIQDWITVTKVYLSAPTAGYVTLIHPQGGGLELGRISIGKTRAQYLRFLLHDIPSDVITYTCDVTRNIPDMVNDTDEPLLPEDFHDLLLDMSELKETKKSDDPTRYSMLTGLIKDGKQDLLSWMVSHPEYRPPMGGGEASGRSRLGPWFPSDY